MKGVDRREKKYVEVVADFSEDGRVTPLEIVWDDGRRFSVDKVVDGRWAANMKLGGRGYRYTVMVGGRERLLCPGSLCRDSPRSPCRNPP